MVYVARIFHPHVSSALAIVAAVNLNSGQKKKPVFGAVVGGNPDLNQPLS